MDNPCKYCDKANINKPTVLKCSKPCNAGKRFYECEKELINILSGYMPNLKLKGEQMESKDVLDYLAEKYDIKTGVSAGEKF